MSDSESAVPERRPVVERRRLFALAVVAIVLVLGAVIAVISVADGPGAGPGGSGGIADGPFLKPPVGADRVPAGRTVSEIPDDCGVSKATAARLAPGADPDPEKGGVFREGGPGRCKWYSLDDGKAKCDWCMGDFKNERVLDVEINRARGERQAPITEAMQWVAAGGPGLTPVLGPAKIVEGLGEEAVAHYSAATDMEGASVAFRVGNAVVSVRYKGWDAVRGEKRTISEKVATEGAFAAAAEAAKSLGTSARPVVSEVRRPVTPPLREVPKPCDTVPAATVDKVARDGDRRRGRTILLATVPAAGTSYDGCTWHAGSSPSMETGASRTLTVSIGIAEEHVPGAGASTAARQFEGLYRNQRIGRSPTADTFTGFRPLTGPGDGAFAVTMGGRTSSQGDVGLVVFRKRNVLVEVAYQGRDGETKLRGNGLIDGAYTVAVAVERSLKS